MRLKTHNSGAEERDRDIGTTEIDAYFKKWGYGPFKDRCWICGNTPTRSEPRFGYLACKNCCNKSPIEFNHGKYRPN